MHAVAAEAVVHEQAFAVVSGVSEYLREGGGVRACMPRCVLVLVTSLATGLHGDYILLAQDNLLGDAAGEVHAHMAKFGCQRCLVTLHAADRAVSGVVHGADQSRHLMATGAALA